MNGSGYLSYRQVRVGDALVGMTGLDEILAALYTAGLPPDEAATSALLARARQHNYIAPAAEAHYAEALLREFRQYCRQRAAGCTYAVNYGSWRGHPREMIPWYPTIYADLCNGCGACLRFCRFGVLAPAAGDKVEVVEPFKCQVSCSACVDICKPGAISFPPQEVLDAFGG